MSKMKLPDGWVIDSDGDLHSIPSKLLIRVYPNQNELGVRVMYDERCGNWGDVPAPAVLAVIRAANLDPVYVEAKKLITACFGGGGIPGSGIHQAAKRLNDLIESLEEKE